MCGPALTPQTPALLLLIGPDLNKAAVEPASDPNDWFSFLSATLPSPLHHNCMHCPWLLLTGPDLNKAAVEPASDPNDYPSFSKEDMKRGLEALQTGARLAADQVWKSVGRRQGRGGGWGC